MPSVYVDTTEFFNAHFHQPRPSQIGFWVFTLRTRGHAGFIDNQHQYHGTYAESLKQAKQNAKSTGAFVIYVHG